MDRLFGGVSKLRVDWAALLRGAEPVVATKEAGLGRALRGAEVEGSVPAAPAGLLRRGIPLPAAVAPAAALSVCRLAEDGRQDEPLMVGLTYAVAFSGCRDSEEKFPTLWTRCWSWPGEGMEDCSRASPLHESKLWLLRSSEGEALGLVGAGTLGMLGALTRLGMLLRSLLSESADPGLKDGSCSAGHRVTAPAAAAAAA